MYFIWSLVERFGTSAISLVGNLVLAYVLMPEDFGLVASLAVFTSVQYALIDCGMSDGLLSMSRPTRRDFNTVFYFNVVVGTALCLTYVLLAPWVAEWFGRWELCAMMRAFGVGALLSGLTIAQMTRLRSQLQFRKIAIINLCAVSLALAVAVVMALLGCRYWALVELQVGYTAWVLMGLLVSSNWQLRWEFDVACFKRLWHFGVNLLCSTLLTQISQNIFTTLLGKYYHQVQAGYMLQAQKLQQTPVNALEMSLSGTSMVLIAKSEQPAERSRLVLRMFGVVSLAVAVLCGWLLAVSHPVIDVLFKDAWLPVVPYFRLMLLWGMVYPMGNFMMVVFKLFNRTSVIRNVLLVEKSLVIALAWWLYRYGVVVMIAGATSLSLLSLLWYMSMAQRVTGIAMRQWLSIYAGNVLLGLTLAAATYGVIRLIGGSLIQLVVGSVVFVALLAVACRIWRREYYDEVLSRVCQLAHRSRNDRR